MNQHPTDESDGSSYIILFPSAAWYIFESTFAVNAVGTAIWGLEFGYGQAELEPDEEATDAEDSTQSPQQQGHADTVGGSKHDSRCHINTGTLMGR